MPVSLLDRMDQGGYTLVRRWEDWVKEGIIWQKGKLHLMTRYLHQFQRKLITPI